MWGCLTGYGFSTLHHGGGGRLNLDGRLQAGGTAWGAGPQQQASARMATASSVLGARQPQLSGSGSGSMYGRPGRGL